MGKPYRVILSDLLFFSPIYFFIFALLRSVLFISIMFDQEIFDELCSLIENGGKVRESAMKVAKKYETTTSRLLKWFYAKNPHLKHNRNSCLSEQQEEQLIYAMIAMSHVNL